MGELLLILVVALLVVGPDKLPDAARKIGKGIRDFRRHTVDLQNTIEQDENLGAAVRELKSALRDEPIRPRPAAATTPRTPLPPPSPPEPPAADAPPLGDAEAAAPAPADAGKTDEAKHG
ncbi:MAG TPA: twin-arginine translocase TatA/TatE family subunit [Kofleriaceae bacterium]|nr:twin-arginine translocase TatA/TatE family subunit [Kofleriaceae bacterium]